ncbi:MAG: hypothetical protein QGH60_10450 [Phycisphaerae bacterium]|jgi:hypothetical protein|nr:hypothetical protein [Phycisphaerae bacterium]
MSDALGKVLSGWVRLGAAFSVPTARKTPDIEQLLVETARVMPQFARVHSMMISWLVRYRRLVCRHRLAVLAERIESPEQSAALGLTLTLARNCAESDHFNLAIKACKPFAPPIPMFHIDRQNDKFIALAGKLSCKEGRQWGLWTPQERLYDDAIRPHSWIMQKNPSLHNRAIFSGKLPASILVTLEDDPSTGRSESALARACGATRNAVRDALDHLELCQLVQRKSLKGLVSIFQVEGHRVV